MKKYAIAAALFTALLWGATAGAQTDYYVQSMRAKVMASGSFSARVLGEVTRGEKLPVIGREGFWMKVRYRKHVGYVASLLLAAHPPLQRARIIKADASTINQGVRRRASSYTSAAAARGLAQDDRRRLSREEKADYDSIQKMEAIRVSSAELDRFREGKMP